jgi:hypothetical protein
MHDDFPDTVIHMQCCIARYTECYMWAGQLLVVHCRIVYLWKTVYI